jgi:uncharacterized membrane protein YjgN (DUF898 family)
MSNAVSAPTTSTPVGMAIAAALAAMPSAAVAPSDTVAAPAIARRLAASADEPLTDDRILRFSWTGRPWSLAGTCLFNAAMAVLTVGVYSFWGRTEIRRRQWSSVRLDGEPLVYHGTGLELFKGFIGVLLLVLLPMFLISTALLIIYGQASGGWVLYQIALFAVVYPVLKALATYRARRYRLARTSWRGVRGSMLGSSAEFAFLSWATSLLYPLTLGWIAPWRALYIQRFLAGDTMLGDRALEMKGSTPSLYLRFGLLWVATLAIGVVAFSAIASVLEPMMSGARSFDDWARFGPAIGLKVLGIALAALFVWSPISAFYRSSLYNLTANATALLPRAAAAPIVGSPAHFKLTTTGRSLLWLFVTNQIISYGSLFILKPVATARSMRYFASNLSIVGNFDPASIRQNPNAARAEGEGLAQAFDFDGF